MHIPTAFKEEDVVSFEDALTASGHKGSYDDERWIYVPDYYTEFRYILGTRGRRPLICIGINPSTAEPGKLDNTLKSVDRIASFNGYDSFIMFNVYAQRATNPDDMDIYMNETLHSENMKAFEYILKNAGNTPSIWAAWGTIIEKRNYLPRCVSEMITIGEKYGATWFTAGKASKKGHPHHPLYLKKDSVLELFNPSVYLVRIR